MTLEEKLKELQKKKSSVKIKSNKGISFFYCDKVSKNSYLELEKISVSFLNRMKAELKIKKSYMRTFDKYWDDRIATAEKIKDKNYRQKIINDVPKAKREEKAKQVNKRLKDLPKTLERLNKQRQKEFASVPKRIVELEKLILAFTPLLTRQVVDEYDGISPDEPNTKIVVIKGREKGDFWTIIEYQDRNLPFILKRRIGWQNEKHKN